MVANLKTKRGMVSRQGEMQSWKMGWIVWWIMCETFFSSSKAFFCWIFLIIHEGD
jgi:hypothetical protein